METSFIIWPQVTGTTYIPDVPAVLNRTHTAGFRSSNWRSTKRKNDFSSMYLNFEKLFPEKLKQIRLNVSPHH